MSKTIHYISGLPRTGSTLLCNILMQNPDFLATKTSGLPAVLEPLKNGWDDIALHHQFSLDESRLKQKNVLNNVLQGYHMDGDRPVVFDKSRGWPILIPTLKWITGSEVKVLVTVRNIRQILESLEALYRVRLTTGLPSQAKNNDFTSLEGRTEHWLSRGGMLGASYETIRDAVSRGNLDSMHFVRFENLTSDPEGTMRSIYDFLGYEYYDHDFSNVKQVLTEEDRFHGFDELHTIRTEVKPVQLKTSLGAFAQKYENSGLEFWENLI